MMKAPASPGRYWILVSGYAMFLDFTIGYFHNIKHPVSGIKHLSEN
jgi:hypothetical protein